MHLTYRMADIFTPQKWRKKAENQFNKNQPRRNQAATRGISLPPALARPTSACAQVASGSRMRSRDDNFPCAHLRPSSRGLKGPANIIVALIPSKDPRSPFARSPALAPSHALLPPSPAFPPASSRDGKVKAGWASLQRYQWLKGIRN